MKELATACATLDIEEILEMPNVKERLDVYFEQDKLFREMLKDNVKTYGNVLVADLREVETIYAGNRFLIYTIYPEQNISLWVVNGKNKVNCVITVGYSIINRTAQVNIGSMLLKYEGGGHKQVGTCQVPYADADQVIKEIIEQCKT
jgi:nanoRNase/pAp phosphatase (c-di-AMP/oligoRNAs hydrolase)